MTNAPSPPERSIDTPVIRCNDSARLVSRQLADIFGRNGIDDAQRVALDRHGVHQRLAQAGNDHFLNGFVGRGWRLRLHWLAWFAPEPARSSSPSACRYAVDEVEVAWQLGASLLTASARFFSVVTGRMVAVSAPL